MLDKEKVLIFLNNKREENIKLILKSNLPKDTKNMYIGEIQLINEIFGMINNNQFNKEVK